MKPAELGHDRWHILANATRLLARDPRRLTAVRIEFAAPREEPRPDAGVLWFEGRGTPTIEGEYSGQSISLIGRFHLDFLIEIHLATTVSLVAQEGAAKYGLATEGPSSRNSARGSAR